MSGLLPLIDSAAILYKKHESKNWTVWSKQEKLETLKKIYDDEKGNKEKALALKILDQAANDTYITGHLKTIYDILVSAALTTLLPYELDKNEQALVEKIGTSHNFASIYLLSSLAKSFNDQFDYLQPAHLHFLNQAKRFYLDRKLENSNLEYETRKYEQDKITQANRAKENQEKLLQRRLELSQQNYENRKKIKLLIAENDDLQDNLESLNRQLDDTENEIGELKDEVYSLLCSKEEKNVIIDNLSADLELTRKKTRYYSQKYLLEKLVNQSQFKYIEHKDKVINHMRGNLREIKALRNENNSLYDKMIDLREDKNELQSENKSLKSERKELQQELKFSRNAIATYIDIIDKLQDENIKIQQEKASAPTNKASTESLDSALHSAKGTIEELQKQNGELRRQNDVYAAKEAYRLSKNSATFYATTTTQTPKQTYNNNNTNLRRRKNH